MLKPYRNKLQKWRNITIILVKNDVNHKMWIILTADFSNNGYWKKMDAVSIENIWGRVGRFLAKGAFEYI